MISDAFSRAYAEFILRNRWAVVVVSVLVSALLAAGIPNLGFSDSNQAFFGDDNPEVVQLRELENSYTRSSSVFFQLAVDEGTVFAPDILRLLHRTTEEAWQIPYVLRVESLANYNDSRAEGDEIIVAPLIADPETIDDAKAAAIKRMALASDELVHALVSKAGDALGISVSVAIPRDSKVANQEIAEYVRNMAAKIEKENPGITVSLTGSVISSVTLREAARNDLEFLIPIATVLAFILLAIGIGSVAGVVGCFLTMAFSTLAGLGFAGWIGISLTPGTAVSPLAVMVLVIAGCVHVVMTSRSLVDAGESATDALIHSLTEHLAGVSVTSITTAIGFLSLRYASSPALQEMGTLIAAGIVFGWLLCITFLPALCSMVPDARLPMVMLKPETLGNLVLFSIRHRRKIVAATAFLIVSSFYGISKIGFEDNFIKYFDRSFEFRRDAAFIEEKLTGLNSIQFSLNSGRERGIFDPDFLNRVDRFVGWLETRPKVVHVASTTKLLKRLNRSMNGDDPDKYRIAGTADQNAQFMMFYELSLPVGQDLNTVMNIERSKMLVTMVMKDATSEDLRRTGREAEQWLQQNEPKIFAKATGFSLVFANISMRNNQSMIYGTALELVAIAGIMIVVLWNVRMGLMALIPNILPALFTFGVWGLTLSNLNLGSSIVTSMSFGIVVDDTTHFLIAYFRARGISPTPADAIVRATKSVGNAMILTSVVIALGFIIMGFSPFQINEHIGWLTAVVVSIAVVCDLVLLPPIILALERRFK